MHWPLTGRDEEHARLVAALRAGRSVVVTGPAGVGKSRLAAEAASADGARVVAVTGTATAAEVPFGAFGPLLPESLPDANPVGAAIAALLEAHLTGEGRPRVRLLVDDAHLLDHASAVLVHHLARSGRAELVVTVRSGEPAPDAVTALWKEDDAHRLDLEPLDEAATRTLLDVVLGGPVATRTARRMWQLSTGVVLYLRELVMAGLADGTLAIRNGFWTWTGNRPPARLSELVEERLGRLSAVQRDTLELVALGEPLELAVLTGLVDDEPVEVLEERQVVTVKEEGVPVVRLSHPLYGEVVLERCPALRRRRHQKTLADAVEEAGRVSRSEVVRVARWRLDAGVPQDPSHLLAAARLAWASGDGALSIELARGALETSTGVAERAVRAVAAGELAERMVYMGRGDEALQVLDMAPDAGDERVRAKVGLMRAFALDELERIEESDEVVDQVLSGADAMAPDDRVLVRGSCAGIISPRDCTRSLAILDELSVEDVLHADRLDFLACWACLLAIAGRRAEADEYVQLCLDAGEDRLHGDPVATGHLAYASLTAASLAGDLAEPERPLDATPDRYAATSSFAYPRHMSLYRRAHLMRLRGRYAAALELIDEPEILQTDHVASALASAEAAYCLVMLGRLDRAEEIARQASRGRSRHLRLLLVDLDLAAIWRAALTGDRSRARALAAALAGEMRTLGALGWEMFALEDLVRLGGGEEAADRLEEIAQVQQGPLAQTCAAHARARDGAQLQAVGVRFEQIGMLAHAASAHADASLAYTRDGHRARAHRSAARARVLARQCDPGTSPTLTGLEAPRLTRRERDIAHLAATGMASRQIADRLTLSVRTVENHLYSAYGKLGVHSRDELHRLLAGDVATG